MEKRAIVAVEQLTAHDRVYVANIRVSRYASCLARLYSYHGWRVSSTVRPFVISFDVMLMLHPT